jgi:hypothetical protein
LEQRAQLTALQASTTGQRFTAHGWDIGGALILLSWNKAKSPPGLECPAQRRQHSIRRRCRISFGQARSDRGRMVGAKEMPRRMAPVRLGADGQLGDHL